MEYTADTYRLSFAADRPYVIVDTARGERVAELFVLSSVHPLNGRDDTLGIGEWEVDPHPEETSFTLRAASSAWHSKTYRFRCRPNRFTYEVEVEGRGDLAETNLFGGYYSGQVRWGSGFFWSGQRFRCGFNPEPDTGEVYHFNVSGASVIDLTGAPLPGRADWFFTPPPFCFSMQLADDGWLSLGVEAHPGENRFTGYGYHGQSGAFFLSLSYEGHTAVNGAYKLPAIGFDFADDEYGALTAHVSALHKSGCVKTLQPEEKPRWWFTPIFCGWGSQCYQARLEKGRAPDYARQDLCEGHIAALERNNIRPGIVVIDDKWQATYGENCVDERKWPDLAGFISGQHEKGRKALLWLKAWDAEGLPAEECILNAGGMVLAADPTNPSYEHRLRSSVRRMLSPAGYNADGFKIDFTARIPSGPGICTHGDLWGLELMRSYLAILHSEAKKVKPDALIMTHTPHPYLADVVDMIRLNDINCGADINRAMTHRARVATIACPNAPIDTDNWPMPDKESWRKYTRLQPSLGVPSLYFSTHIDSTGEPLTAEDYQLIRDTWQEHVGRVGNSPM